MGRLLLCCSRHPSLIGFIGWFERLPAASAAVVGGGGAGAAGALSATRMTAMLLATDSSRPISAATPLLKVRDNHNTPSAQVKKPPAVPSASFSSTCLAPSATPGRRRCDAQGLGGRWVLELSPPPARCGLRSCMNKRGYLRSYRPAPRWPSTHRRTQQVDPLQATLAVARALHYLHDGQGMVHRDVKPGARCTPAVAAAETTPLGHFA